MRIRKKSEYPPPYKEGTERGRTTGWWVHINNNTNLVHSGQRASGRANPTVQLASNSRQGMPYPRYIPVCPQIHTSFALNMNVQVFLIFRVRTELALMGQLFFLFLLNGEFWLWTARISGSTLSAGISGSTYL